MNLATTADIDAIFAQRLGALLGTKGFATPAPRPRKWVRARPPLRDVFELSALKGASFIPRWGISLDFVPHLEGDAVRWHRSDKSARMDVAYDLADFDPNWWNDWTVRTLRPADKVAKQADCLLPAAVSRAVAWFDTFQPRNLGERIEQFRAQDRPGGRYGFDAYVQPPLALAFSLARDGRTREARETLDGWASEAGAGHACSAKALAKLKELLEQTRGSG